MQCKQVDLRVSGDWELQVAPGPLTVGNRTIDIAKPTTLALQPPPIIEVESERHEELALFDENSGGWVKGNRLSGVATQETTAKGSLIPDSLMVQAANGSGEQYLLHRDYEADTEWGTLGRKPDGRLKEGEPVEVSYRFGLARIDSITVDAQGNVRLLIGTPHICNPQPPIPPDGEWAIANIWLPPLLTQLGVDHIFPIGAEMVSPDVSISIETAKQLIPVTLRKLDQGKLRILAWGDSVTDGSYLPDPATERWQNQFVDRLRALYPAADIELITEAWGGRNTDSYLAEPAGSEHNYQEKVLAVKPDLVISEFVNDAWMDPEMVEQRYSRFLRDFQAIGAEWIILTPHYVRPDWMGLSTEREIDDDPRPYVAGLRQFTEQNNVLLADASLRWGHLWRQGIPYTTLLSNAINHPNPRGMKLFADTLIAFFTLG